MIGARRWAMTAAIVGVVTVVACTTAAPRQAPRITTQDLVVEGASSVITWDGPFWRFHDGRLFSIFAHTFGRRVFDEEHALAEVVVRNNVRFPQRLTFWLDLSPYASEAVKEIELQPGEVRSVLLSPTFDYERLYALRSPTPVQVKGGFENHFTDEVVRFDATPILEPVTRLQWRVPASNGRPASDLRPFVVMLVTPDDKGGEVQKLVREAASLTKVGRFRGYDNATPDDVRDQVAALYQALQNRRYIYNSVASTYFDEVQRVRLPAEALQQNHGNCIDTTLVFASAFEAVGLEPLIVFMPGHAFVGVDQTPAKKDKTKKRWLFVETTMVDQSPFVDAMNKGGETYMALREAEEGKGGIVVNVKKGRRSGLYPVNF
jgi:hypothetical protein